MKPAEKKHALEKGSPVPQDKPRLKMKALMEATNSSKATILHYVQKGLLPKPVKTSRNMAYYDPLSIDLIKSIKYLQSRYRLPLSAIKEIIKGQDAGGDVFARSKTILCAIGSVR